MSQPIEIQPRSSDLHRSDFFPLAIVLAIVSGLLLLEFKTSLLFVATIVGAACFFWALQQVLRGNAEPLLLSWILLYPFGYYFLSFPQKGSFVTLDRVLIIALAACWVFNGKRKSVGVPSCFLKAGIAWFVFLAAAALSLVMATEWIGPLRNLIDSFLLPAVLGWWIVSQLRVTEYLRTLHIVCCLTTLAIFSVGLLELLLLDDLMSFSAGTFFRFSADGGLLLRVNGPFETNNSYALIGLSLFFLLAYLRSAQNQLSGWHRLLHPVAAVAALAISLMPLFRSVMVSLFAILIIETVFFTKNARRRLFYVAGLAILVAIVLTVRGASPSAIEDRMNFDNLYARIAQQFQTFDLFFRSPLIGVGFGNFINAATRFTSTTFKDVASVDSAHSNVGSVLAETGLLGLIPYVLSQVFLFKGFLYVKRSSQAGKQAFPFLLFLFMGYWINGLALTSGYYGDLNMIWIFSLMVIVRHAMLAGQSQPAATVKMAGR